MNKNKLTFEEWNTIHRLKYMIRPKWIGPIEKYEYRVSYAGKEELLAVRKSERAAYNFIIKTEKMNFIKKRKIDWKEIECMYKKFLFSPLIKLPERRGL